MTAESATVLHWTAEFWAAAATIAAVWAVTVVSPGPNFLITAQAAARYDRRAGLLVAAGIGLGTLIWAGGSLAGLAVLFRTAAWAYTAVKLIGAAYLVVAGLLMVRAALRPAAGAAATPIPSGRAFRIGLLTDLSNPKAAAFFASLFAVAVPPSAPVDAQAALALLVTAMAWGWYSLVAVAMTTPPVLAAYRRAERWIVGITGAVFAGIGVRLAVER